MLEHYRKTFTSMQITIAIITVGVALMTHRLVAALVFFLVMQLGSLAGALWATRLKDRFRAAGWLPPRAP